jgi:transcription termination/antitermination protein NusG
MEENMSEVQETKNLQIQDQSAEGTDSSEGVAEADVVENPTVVTEEAQASSEVTDAAPENISAFAEEIVPAQDESSVGSVEEQTDQPPQEEAVVEAVQPDVKPEPKWYIVQVLTGQEDRVKERIESSLDEMELREKVYRVLVPEEETVEIKGDRRIERKRKMYPGYVFIEMALDEDTWYKIRSTLGVARFIGGKTHPTPVTDREIQRVLKQIGIKEKELTVEFEIGEAIRIISGSFRGYTGSVHEINAAKSKMKVMVNIFGRDTSVEVDFDRVEKVV